MRIGAALDRVVAGETRKGFRARTQAVFGIGCSPRKDHGLPAVGQRVGPLYQSCAVVFEE